MHTKIARRKILLDRNLRGNSTSTTRRRCSEKCGGNPIAIHAKRKSARLLCGEGRKGEENTMPEQPGSGNQGNQPTGQQTFRCKECGQTLRSPEELKEHTKKHQGQGQQGQGQQSGGTHRAGGGSE